MGPISTRAYTPAVQDPEQLVLTDFVFDDVSATLRIVTLAMSKIRKKKGWKSEDLRELKDIRSALHPYLSEKKRATLSKEEVMDLNAYTVAVRLKLMP